MRGFGQSIHARTDKRSCNVSVISPTVKFLSAPNYYFSDFLLLYNMRMIRIVTEANANDVLDSQVQINVDREQLSL